MRIRLLLDSAIKECVERLESLDVVLFQCGMPDIKQQHKSVLIRLVPDAVLKGSVQKEHLSLAPLFLLLSHHERTLVIASLKSKVNTNTQIGVVRVTVRSDRIFRTNTAETTLRIMKKSVNISQQSKRARTKSSVLSFELTVSRIVKVKTKSKII
jgi:hypothetical protein